MVSEVIGEMLKLSIVVMLASAVAVSVYGLIPEERVPYIEVIAKCSNNTTGSTVNITHAGGDPVDSIEIIISYPNGTPAETPHIINGTWRFPEMIPLNTTIKPPFEVSVVHTRAVLARVRVEKCSG